MVWFDPEMPWLSERGNGKRGRDATFSDAAIQFCLMVKALYGLPLRQSTGLVSSLLALAGLDWAARERPDISTLVSVAADSPFLPGDLVARLTSARAAQGARLAVAACAITGQR